MLIKLGGRALRALGGVSELPFVARITTDPSDPHARRHEEILLSDSAEVPAGFRANFFRGAVDSVADPTLRDQFVLGSEFAYLTHGDVVRCEPQRGALHVLYRRNSRSNSLLVTERCDNYCLMCSQPPKRHDDSWLVDDLLRAIPLMSTETAELGITGGEPTLLGERLFELIEACSKHLPSTALHILSNGRSFSSFEYSAALGRRRHPDLMLGIPLYGDLPEVHDYVVQARGAFDQTLRGIVNLKRAGVRVELRFVIHAETVGRLPAFARFVARNLLFVDQVALMGLELMGFARSNLDALWIDPADYQDELEEAVATLDRAGMAVSIYNHQLCVLRSDLHAFARASISDWKNLYFDECGQCALRSTCGGFFASAQLRKSRGVRPIPA